MISEEDEEVKERVPTSILHCGPVHRSIRLLAVTHLALPDEHRTGPDVERDAVPRPSAPDDFVSRASVRAEHCDRQWFLFLAD